MPKFEWKEGDASGSLLFFPFVGIVIGAAVCVINLVGPFSALPAAVRILLTMAAPLVITGGIHVDGFMDTEDALNSYAVREKKLEILKDPHTGAFAVISLVKWMLIYAAAVSAILLRSEMGESSNAKMPVLLGLTFVISRCFCGLTSLVFQRARKNGMLYEVTRNSKRAEVVWLAAELVIVGALMLYLDLPGGAAVLLTFGVFTAYYRKKAYKEFGGVTGDTTGWFLTVGEILAAIVIALRGYL